MLDNYDRDIVLARIADRAAQIRHRRHHFRVMAVTVSVVLVAGSGIFGAIAATSGLGRAARITVGGPGESGSVPSRTVSPDTTGAPSATANPTPMVSSTSSRATNVHSAASQSPSASEYAGQRDPGDPASASPAQPTESLAAYSANGLNFSYPNTWQNASYPDDVSSFSNGFLYLSNQVLSDPCRTTSSGQITSKSCGWPVTSLRSDGVLVSWSVSSMPGWTIASAAGTPLTVDGLPARRDVGQPGLCAAIGGQETVSVVIATGQSSHYSLTACLAGPDTTGLQAQVDALLSTVKITNP